MNPMSPNLGRNERLARVAAAVFLSAVGLAAVIRGVTPMWLDAADAVSVALGINLLITGITGYCPIYHWLGWDTASRPER